MKIEDAGELHSFETIPTEMTLFLSVVRWEDGTWAGGPYGETKADVVRALTTIWTHSKEARIYAVKLPTSLRREEDDHAR